MNIEKILEPWRISKKPRLWKIDIKGRNVLILKMEKEIREQRREAVKKRMRLLEELGIINLSMLTPRERAILKLRFFECKNLEEVGQEFEVTRERIRQLEMKAIEKIRKNYKAI
jgi:RNA polymerase sigma factor (sigma-70 family)